MDGGNNVAQYYTKAGEVNMGNNKERIGYGKNIWFYQG